MALTQQSPLSDDSVPALANTSSSHSRQSGGRSRIRRVLRQVHELAHRHPLGIRLESLDDVARAHLAFSEDPQIDATGGVCSGSSFLRACGGRRPGILSVSS
jgi:hypothetical protein